MLNYPVTLSHRRRITVAKRLTTLTPDKFDTYTFILFSIKYVILFFIHQV